MSASSLRRLRTTVEPPGARLFDALAAWLPGALGRPVSRSIARRLIIVGAVRVRDKVVRNPAEPLVPGDVIDIDVDEARLPNAAAHVPFVPRILYEDDAVIAIDKPPGLAVHAGADRSRPDLVRSLQAWLAARDGNALTLGVHQRLDRDTSGVIVFAKAPEANAGLAEQFAGRTVTKTYLALVEGKTPPPPVWEATGEVVPERSARTLFRRVELLRRGALVEAQPETGRKHQIRVHLAQGGWPIVGDARYGGRVGPLRPLLHASRIELRHPLTKAPLRIESPLPADFLAELASRRAQAERRAATSGEKLQRPPRPGALSARRNARRYAAREHSKAPKRAR